MLEGYDLEWVEFEENVGIPDMPNEPGLRRAAFDDMLVNFSKQLPPTDPEIQSRDEQISPEVKVRIYTPSGTGGRRLPLIVFVHGGGWLAGDLNTEDHLCRVICAATPSIVVSVDYRLFPEVKFPSPIDDCYRAYEWAYEHADDLGADKDRYSIMGGSAGAALANAVVYKLVSSGKGSQVSGLIDMAGMFLHPDAVPEKYQHLHVSYVENAGPVPFVTGDGMRLAYELVVGQSGFTEDLSWFPLIGGADALQGFPRTYIINTEKEASRDDGRVLEAALEDVGIPVKRDVLPGLPHYFWCFPVQQAGERFRETLIEGIKWVVHTS